MVKKEFIFLCAIVLVGFIDWLTTVTGVLFFGATEVNPVLSGLTKSSMILFSAVKLSAVIFVGLAFYIATAISKPQTNGWHLTKRFIYGGYSLTLLMLTVVVSSNMITLFRI
jgi:hypothetical protein